MLRQGLLHTYAPKIGTSVPKIISKGQKKKKREKKRKHKRN